MNFGCFCFRLQPKNLMLLSHVFVCLPLSLNLTFFFGIYQTLSAADLRDPEISALVAAKLREFNNLDMPGSKDVLLWERLR